MKKFKIKKIKNMNLLMIKIILKFKINIKFQTEILKI